MGKLCDTAYYDITSGLTQENVVLPSLPDFVFVENEKDMYVKNFSPETEL